MPEPPPRKRRRLWAAVVGCLALSLVGCATTATGSDAVGTPPGGVPDSSVRVLQLNLCSSGIAGCYTGRSTAEAAAVIHAEVPDLVTLNEVCRDDVTALQRALAEVVPGDAVTSAFQPALDRRTGEAWRCRNGQEYGIGIVSRWPSVPGSSAGGGIYPSQDSEDPEDRAWLCLIVAATPAVAVCTTHLADTDRKVAVAQCRYLFSTVAAGVRHARNEVTPLLLGGDLNLGSGGADLESCRPAGFALADDGGQQHVVATPEYVVAGSRTIDLRGTTDHPGLLVTLVSPTGR